MSCLRSRGAGSEVGVAALCSPRLHTAEHELLAPVCVCSMQCTRCCALHLQDYRPRARAYVCVLCCAVGGWVGGCVLMSSALAGL